MGVSRFGSVLVLLSVIDDAYGSEYYVSFHQQSYSTKPMPRALSVAVLQHTVADTSALGRYLWVFGGLSSSMGTLDDLWMLNMQSSQWSPATATGSVPSARRGATMVLSQQRFAFLFGGETSSRQRLSDMFVLNLGTVGANPEWVSINYNASSSATPAARSEHTFAAATLLQLPHTPSGMILFGGADQAGKALADLHAFEFGTLQWHALSPAGTSPQKRKGHAASVLLNSLMVVMGGSDQVCDSK